MKLLTELKSPSKRNYVFPSSVALIYAGLGEKDRALEWLEKGYREHDAGLVYLKIEPGFDPLRSDPRFKDLVRRVGLPE